MIIVMVVLGQEVCACHAVRKALLVVLCIHTGPDAAQVPIACTTKGKQLMVKRKWGWLAMNGDLCSVHSE